ncbi:hypothetical protein C8R43DRAFT_1004503 [Mycena crocata]|nr:hypothetical protein C8R43DRAFT_1004503 [Mycena crocata]
MPGGHIRFSPTHTTFSSGPAPLVPHRAQSYSSAGNIRAHNILAFSDTPFLHYDISLSPSSTSTNFMAVSPADFHESAVHPPQPNLSLLTPYLPWTIPVSASNKLFVTVADVLHALHLSLRTNVTPTEFQTLGTPKLMRRTAAAYTQRYERLSGQWGYEEEKRHGVRRVDFLMGCTLLQGISPTDRDPTLWQFHVR